MVDFKYAKLRGKIRSKYVSETNFADALHTTQMTLSRKLNNKTEFKKSDMIKWCGLLDIPIQEVGSYFFDDEV